MGSTPCAPRCDRARRPGTPVDEENLEIAGRPERRPARVRLRLPTVRRPGTRARAPPSGSRPARPAGTRRRQVRREVGPGPIAGSISGQGEWPQRRGPRSRSRSAARSVIGVSCATARTPRIRLAPSTRATSGIVAPELRAARRHREDVERRRARPRPCGRPGGRRILDRLAEGVRRGFRERRGGREPESRWLDDDDRGRPDLEAVEDGGEQAAEDRLRRPSSRANARGGWRRAAVRRDRGTRSAPGGPLAAPSRSASMKIAMGFRSSGKSSGTATRRKPASS